MIIVLLISSILILLVFFDQYASYKIDTKNITENIESTADLFDIVKFPIKVIAKGHHNLSTVIDSSGKFYTVIASDFFKTYEVDQVIEDPRLQKVDIHVSTEEISTLFMQKGKKDMTHEYYRCKGLNTDTNLG